MKVYATISADIVASTSLSRDNFVQLIQLIKTKLDSLSCEYHGFWGRLVKGDSIECVMENPNNALRIALLLKTLVKSFVPSDGVADERFKRHGLRLVIGIGGMRMIDKELDIMDGEAIYLSGRELANMKSRRIYGFQIKKSPNLSEICDSIDEPLVGFIIDKGTSRQCETLFYRMQFDKDQDVADVMNISRAGVNNNLLSIGWDFLENTLQKFEKINFKKNAKDKIIALLKAESLYCIEDRSFERANSYFETALSICSQEYGSEHLKVAYLYLDFLDLFILQKDYKKAFDYCKKSIAILKKELSETDPIIATTDKKLNTIRKKIKLSVFSNGNLTIKSPKYIMPFLGEYSNINDRIIKFIPGSGLFFSISSMGELGFLLKKNLGTKLETCGQQKVFFKKYLDNTIEINKKMCLKNDSLVFHQTKKNHEKSDDRGVTEANIKLDDKKSGCTCGLLSHKTEIPKAVVPKTRTRALNTEVPKAVVPKTEVPKVVISKIRTRALNTGVPKAVVPKTEVPKTEVPKVVIPKTRTRALNTGVPKAVVPKTRTKVLNTGIPKAILLRQKSSSSKGG